MDGLSLLEEASAAGLKVRRDGDRLVVRGPRDAEALARELLSHKAAVFTALGQRPDDACHFCGGPTLAELSQEATRAATDVENPARRVYSTG